VAAASPTTAVGAKGSSQDQWSTFCIGGEISSAAVTKDAAGFVSRQLRHVSRVGLRWFIVLCACESHGCLWQATDFTDRVVSGALTAEYATEVERLRAQHTDAIQEKSAAENKSHRLTKRLAAVEVEKWGSPVPAGGGEEGREQGHC
jgi:hypothetical protein